MSEPLPARPSLEHLKKQAKQRLKTMRSKDPAAKLADAQLKVARSYGFNSWQKLLVQVRSMMVKIDPPVDVVRALEEAISRDDESTVRELLDQHPNVINLQHTDGRTPLHYAAETNNAPLVNLLLKCGADTEAKYGQSAHTPLSWAITIRAQKAVDALVKHGASVDLYCAAGLGLLPQVRSYFTRDGQLKPNASRNGSSRFAKDGTRLPRPPKLPREIISDALYNACRNAQPAVVKFLLARNPDLSFGAYLNATPLHWAFFSASLETIQLMLDAGADPTLRDDVFHCTPRAFGICVNASWGIFDLLKQQLRNDPSLLNVHDGRGTPLHEAARSGNKAIVQILLDAGADRSLKDSDDKTAHQLAIDGKHTDVVDLLNHAGPSLVDTFLKLAVPDPTVDHRAGSIVPAAKLLKKHPELRSASIFTACATGSVDALRTFLSDDKSAANTPGGPLLWPPLCYLAFSRFLRDDKTKRKDILRCAKLLLDAGADPNSFFPASNNPKDRETALYGAAGVANDPELTQLLLDAGADVNDHESLYHASEFADNAALKVLLKVKPKPKWTDYCLCHKMDMEDPAGVKLFISAGADVNRLIEGGQMQGYRPLHFAISRRRSVEIIKLLLDAGANPNLPAADGTSPYKYARRLGRSELADFLFEHGAVDDLTPRDKLVAALSLGDRNAVRKLIAGDKSVLPQLTKDDHKLLVGAAFADNVAAVRLMLDMGFPIETRTGTKAGWDANALHHAAWAGHLSVIRLLLKRGANPKQEHSYGGNALGAAIHGATHAGHARGAAAVRLIAAAMDLPELRKSLDYAISKANPPIVKVLQEVIRKREASSSH
jgi:ankyrin repeat protein